MHTIREKNRIVRNKIYNIHTYVCRHISSNFRCVFMEVSTKSLSVIKVKNLIKFLNIKVAGWKSPYTKWAESITISVLILWELLMYLGSNSLPNHHLYECLIEFLIRGKLFQYSMIFFVRKSYPDIIIVICSIAYNL